MRAAMALALVACLAPALAQAQPAQPAPGRYGPRTPVPAAPPAPTSAETEVRHYLNWTGKTLAAPPPLAVAAEPARPEPLSGWAVRQSAYPAPVPVRSPPQARAPAPPQVTASVRAEPPALPASIYEPPPARGPAAAPAAPVAAPQAGPRIYSLHRDFGMQPDSAPATVRGLDAPGITLGDMTETRRPMEARRITDANGKTRTVERPRDDGPPATGLGAPNY